jgi:hypothetical protein
MDETNKVSKWVDIYKGREYTADLATAPTYSSAKKALVFGGAQFMQRNHVMDGTNEVTYIYVMKIVNTASTVYIHSHNPSGSSHVYQRLGLGSSVVQFNFGATVAATLDGSVMAASPKLVIIGANNVTDTGSVLIPGGATAGDASASGAIGTLWYNSANPIILGAYYLLSNFIQCDLMAIITTTTATLSASDLALLKDWAVKRYGVALGSAK